MVTRRLPGPIGPAPKPAFPAPFIRLRCPSCGRETAVVFPLLRDCARSPQAARLVCLDCCPDLRDRLRPARIVRAGTQGGPPKVAGQPQRAA